MNPSWQAIERHLPLLVWMIRRGLPILLLIQAAALLLLLASVILLRLLAEPAHAAPVPVWTILRVQCWQSLPAGQCAVGLYGQFPSLPACMESNGGQRVQKRPKQIEGGVEVAIEQRCELKLQ